MGRSVLDRGRFAGPVGWMDAQGDGEWAVALRCGQIDATDATRMRLYAGGGIMAASDPHAELVETAKAEFVALTPPEAVQTGYLTENLALFTSRAELDLEHGAVQTVEASREHTAGGVGVVPLLRVIHGKDAERRTSDAARQRKELSWEE